jgi:hypothetical protein
MSNSLPKVEAFLSALKEQSFFKDENTQGSVLWYNLNGRVFGFFGKQLEVHSH